MLNGKTLQVGKSYIDGEGKVVKLTEALKGEHRYCSSDDGYYTKTGQFWLACKSKKDLVEECTLEEFNVVTKPKHYQLIPDQNIEVKHIVAILADRLGTNGYNGAFIADFAQMLQYLMRFDEKNGKEDLEKSMFFLESMIEKYPDVQTLKGQK